MKAKIVQAPGLLLLVLVIVVNCLSVAQTTSSNPIGQTGDSSSQSVFHRGLTLQVGPGLYSIRDEFISRQNYSGPMPVYLLTWTDMTGKRASNMTLEYRAAAAIKNYNVSASFDINYLYPVGRFSLLSRDVVAYLGPSPEFFIHFRSQNIANGGNAITRAYSAAMLFSAGATLALACAIENALTADASFETNVLSLGARFVNPDNSSEPFLKLLTPFSGWRSKTDIGIRYQLSSNISARLAYRVEIARINAWDYFISGSDMGVLSVFYGF
ncbi:MAG: hypothetical protein HW389_3308 [Bacteroidetes bacterium]|nr:hypothetical protein [Bacteroidota bacterium]